MRERDTFEIEIDPARGATDAGVFIGRACRIRMNGVEIPMAQRFSLHVDGAFQPIRIEVDEIVLNTGGQPEVVDHRLVTRRHEGLVSGFVVTT